MTASSLNPEQHPCGTLSPRQSASEAECGARSPQNASQGLSGASGFDGCNSECRKKGAHTLRWGGCEHAAEPEPRISFFRTHTASDGMASIVTESMTVSELADRIEAALRTIRVQFGPNALAMLQRGETVGLSGGEYAAMALAAAMSLADETTGGTHA